MGGLVPPGGRAALRAYQRSVSNAGFSVGALLSGLALADGSPTALYTLLVLDAATYCFGAYATVRLPGAGRGARRRGLAREVLVDPGYLTAGLLNAAHTVNRSVVSIGLPLWVVYGTHLPHWAVSAAMIANTLTVVLLQTPLSGRAADLAGCGRSLLWAGGAASGGAGLAAVRAGLRRPGVRRDPGRGGRLDRLLRPGPGAAARPLPGDVAVPGRRLQQGGGSGGGRLGGAGGGLRRAGGVEPATGHLVRRARPLGRRAAARRRAAADVGGGGLRPQSPPQLPPRSPRS